VVSIDRKVLGLVGESDIESLLLARYVPNAKVQRAWQQFQTFCASAPENISPRRHEHEGAGGGVVAIGIAIGIGIAIAIGIAVAVAIALTGVVDADVDERGAQKGRRRRLLYIPAQTENRE
jgi:hypothetical protein